jgi:hypothetical protein
LEELGVDGRIILEWLLGNWVGRCELVASDSRLGQVMGSCGRGNEPLGSIKGREFLD